MGEALPDLAAGIEAVPALLRLCERHGAATGAPHTVGGLVDRLIGALIEPNCTAPTLLCHHPLALSPLAKEDPGEARAGARRQCAGSDGRTALAANPGCAERFELLVGGTELCNAYCELNDPAEQRRRFAAQREARSAGDGEAMLPDEDYCTALECACPPAHRIAARASPHLARRRYGLPPTVGFGLGIDRLVMLLCGARHIRDALAFPLHR